MGRPCAIGRAPTLWHAPPIGPPTGAPNAPGEVVYKPAGSVQGAPGSKYCKYRTFISNPAHAPVRLNMTDKTESPSAGAKPYDAREHDYECQGCGRGLIADGDDYGEGFTGLTKCAACLRAECYEPREV